MSGDKAASPLWQRTLEANRTEEDFASLFFICFCGAGCVWREGESGVQHLLVAVCVHVSAWGCLSYLYVWCVWGAHLDGGAQALPGSQLRWGQHLPMTHFFPPSLRAEPGGGGEIPGGLGLAPPGTETGAEAGGSSEGVTGRRICLLGSLSREGGQVQLEPAGPLDFQYESHLGHRAGLLESAMTKMVQSDVRKY